MRNMMRAIVAKIRKRKGFTLVELMLVVVLLGILVAVAMPRFTGRTRQAQTAAAKTDVEGTFAVALDLFELDNGVYPSTVQGLGALVDAPASGSVASNWNGPYLKRGVSTDPWGNDYQYRAPGTRNPHGYDLWSYGADGQEGTDDDIGNWDLD